MSDKFYVATLARSKHEEKALKDLLLLLHKGEQCVMTALHGDARDVKLRRRRKMGRMVIDSAAQGSDTLRFKVSTSVLQSGYSLVVCGVVWCAICKSI